MWSRARENVIIASSTCSPSWVSEMMGGARTATFILVDRRAREPYAAVPDLELLGGV